MSLKVAQEVCTPAQTLGYRTGLKPDRHDPKDFERVYGAPDIPASDEHPIIDLRKYIHQVYEQGNLGTCAACAICAAYELLLKKEAEPMDYSYYHFDSSRLFLYYNSREYEGNTGVDSGAPFCDTLKAIHVKGICRESLWPYKTRKFADRPTPACYDDAKGKTISKYERLRQDIDQFRACLKEGYPFAFGFSMYNSFIIKKNGLMPMPSDKEIASTSEPDMHGVLAVGYNDNTQCITVLNSWGKSFGDKGYFYMPYKYISNPKLAHNFWKIEKSREEIKIVIHNDKKDTNELVEIVVHK